MYMHKFKDIFTIASYKIDKNQNKANCPTRDLVKQIIIYPHSGLLCNHRISL